MHPDAIINIYEERENLYFSREPARAKRARLYIIIQVKRCPVKAEKLHENGVEPGKTDVILVSGAVSRNQNVLHGTWDFLQKKVLPP
jgi:siroheme synthase